MTVGSQPREARLLANEVRVAASAYKNQIRNLPPRVAAERVAEALLSGEERIGPIKIRALLMAITLMGDQKATRVLLRAGVHNFDRRVRDLTPRQRAAVTEALFDVTSRWTA